MTDTLAEIRLTKDEGRELTVYPDSLGIPTVGIGHKVRPADDLKLGDVITDERCDDLFAGDYTGALLQAHNYAWCASLDPTRRRIIVCMCFAMGHKIEKFVNMIKHIENAEYDLAADELLDSLWATEVGMLRWDSRAQVYARILSTGVWE